MAPPLRTRPGGRTGIAGNNQRLSHRGSHRGAISKGFVQGNPLSHQPIGFSLPGKTKDCNSQGYRASRLGLAGTIF